MNTPCWGFKMIQNSVFENFLSNRHVFGLGEAPWEKLRLYEIDGYLFGYDVEENTLWVLTVKNPMF